ncbi:hypothetical protein DL546_007166 [Coniochaeta pulveracea]|uniref:Uncharacterized protein n=1 Tax=Coniochaeta pulveracea TaxID=177199 RepID=A0A420Y969_9PEZI|nr:hypothetical protein DL546_007166 [Coniochaeta pulveracea]
MIRQSTKGQDARKRKEPPSSVGNGSKNAENNARTNKRAKMHDARTIRTQAPDAALKDGELDLQAFLSAREFEIRALETSMKKSKAASTTRAFQKVPRGMRRRTASHNVKRIPKRLRARAAKEMAEDNTPTVEPRRRRPRTTRARIRAEIGKKLRYLAERKRKRKEKADATGAPVEGQERVLVDGQVLVRTKAARPKIRRNTLNEPLVQNSKFRKRQVNKTWLPTHLWHAKRARMTDPKEPLWRFAIPLTPSEKCYRPTHRAAGDKGVVVWDTSYMSTVGVYGSAEGIGRVLQNMGVHKVMLTGQRHRKWRSGLAKWSGMLSKERKAGRKNIGPATIIWNPSKESNNTTEGVDKNGCHPATQRQIFVRVHPSCFFELFNELLKLVKMESPQLYIEDLRFEIGSIELMGPASTEALLSILHPYYTDTESEESHGKVFQSLVGVSNPASLPSDALLAFSVMDPRLKHPPKKVRSDVDESTLLETLTNWPVGDALKPYEAGVDWELQQRTKRRTDYSRRPKSKRVAWESLDLGAGRKGEIGDGLACDYEYLFGLPKDESPETSKQDEGPVYIDAGKEHVSAAAEGAQADATAPATKDKAERHVSKESLLQLHHITKSAFTLLSSPTTPPPTPPPNSLVTVNITLAGRGIARPCARIYRLPTQNPVTLLPSTQAEVPATQSQPAVAVFPSLPANLREQWLSQCSASDKTRDLLHGDPQPLRRMPADADMATRKRLIAESLLNPANPGPLPWERPSSNERDMGGHPLCPDAADLIGFVTTGSYCLTDGKGKAVGSLSVSKALEAVTFARDKAEKGGGQLCVVRNAGENVGWLARWVVN